MLTAQGFRETTLLVCTPVGVATSVVPRASVHTDNREVHRVLLGPRRSAIVRIQCCRGGNGAQMDKRYMQGYQIL